MWWTRARSPRTESRDAAMTWRSAGLGSLEGGWPLPLGITVVAPVTAAEVPASGGSAPNS